ncbi:formate/nitrite transporter family protein [Gracilimonas mengyeensis]|uniref:Formate/nitrite transporter FocA, FNT family n=1 Tax=Gracilimonas mengyeensis TaxID=1302730 RepID=A0A521FN90_9BACT|nr:formate/nitrite transporter family protein [Gracilimonas mengyeensis]SMO97594.1 Formate/nitrite transporter FocA, FNT family [Gracilimonas mengyeensis]
MSNSNSKEAEERQAPRALEIFEAIRAEGEHELERPSFALLWSGLAAGLSMGFSFLTEALLASHLPDANWVPLIAEFGYSIGFLIVILGRQQLFTENTLIPVLQVLNEKSWSVFRNLARLWGIVFFANIVGTMLFSFAIASLSIFDPSVYTHLSEIAHTVVSHAPWETFFRAIFAGWLIALIIWLLPFAQEARFWVIIIITYVIGIGGFSHIIAGSVEGFYGLWIGQMYWGEFLFNFFIPTATGNIVGGVALVAVINYAQVSYEAKKL